MKQKLYFLVAACVILSCQKSSSHHQDKPEEGQQPVAPGMAWSKAFGGTSADMANAISATADGGLIMVGHTGSSNGDLGTGYGLDDVWVLKLDANGNKLWSKKFGGAFQDDAFAIANTTDGGFVIVGTTQSNNGDVSGNHGNDDAWVLKLDASGNKQWSKLFGGSNNDYARAVIATPDGGVLVGGHTSSNDGDINGQHGGGDAWLFKLDATGNQQWSKLFGGSANDFIAAHSIAAAGDGGFVAAATTYSGDGDLNSNNSNGNAWLIKVDASGNKQWDRLYGGTSKDEAQSLVKTKDGGLALAVFTFSNDGDINGNHGMLDTWIAKLDHNGNKQWGKTFGGTNNDGPRALVATADGGVLVGGHAVSNDGDLSGNHGEIDGWVLKLDASGNKQWSKVYGGTGIDIAHAIAIAADGAFVIAGYSNSSNGDVTGHHGSWDAWIVKSKLQ